MSKNDQTQQDKTTQPTSGGWLDLSAYDEEEENNFDGQDYEQIEDEIAETQEDTVEGLNMDEAQVIYTDPAEAKAARDSGREILLLVVAIIELPLFGMPCIVSLAFALAYLLIGGRRIRRWAIVMLIVMPIIGIIVGM